MKIRLHRRGFTPKQVERMRDMLSEGMRQHEIAKVFDVGKTTIAMYLHGKRTGTEVHEDTKPKPTVG